MIPKGRPDRVKGGRSFNARLGQIRAGKFAGKQYPKDGYVRGTTTAQSVSGKVADPASTVGRHFPATTPRTGHDPRKLQYKLDKPGGKF